MHHRPSSSRQQQPLVVIAGWLGSHPKQLQRYRSLYELIIPGQQTDEVIPTCSVVTDRIATPPMVVDAVLYAHPLCVPKQWPDNFIVPTNSTRIQDLAWETLQHIHQTRPSQWMIHVFSNGGCFLWEEIRRILGPWIIPTGSIGEDGLDHEISSTENLTVPQATPALATALFSPLLHHDRATLPNATEAQLHALTELQKRLAGVVFDSCPSRDLRRLPQALSHCRWEDRIKLWVLGHGGWDFYCWDTFVVQQRIQNRSSLYWDRLRNDSWLVPQLYLYSKDDRLIPHTEIDELVQYRQMKLGQELIQYQRWDSSPHCAHYMVHPMMYQQILGSFVQKHLTGNRETLQSRL